MSETPTNRVREPIRIYKGAEGQAQLERDDEEFYLGLTAQQSLEILLQLIYDPNAPRLDRSFTITRGTQR